MKGFNYGWVVVAVGALASCVGFGAVFSLPVFLASIAADTGWARAGIATAMTLNFLVMGVCGFGWGMLSDRIGPRRVLLAGIALLGIGLAASSRTRELWQFVLVYGIVVGAAAGTFMAPMIAAASLWFDRQRALAIALVTAGVGVAPMTISPFAAWLVENMSWRSAQLTIAIGAVAVLAPAALLVRLPASFVPAGAGESGPGLGAETLQAMRSRAFAILGATFFLCCATHSGPIFHTISYAIGCGLPAMTAVTIYSVEGAAGLGGRVLLGVLADRFGALPVLVAGLLVQALAAGSYALATRAGDFYAVALVFGMAYGGVMPLYAVLVRSTFPPQIMGGVLGALAMVSSVGMALGPPIGGWLYDRYGSYAWLYAGSLAVGIAAAFVAITFRGASARHQRLFNVESARAA
jgi:MFS family permease